MPDEPKRERAPSKIVLPHDLLERVLAGELSPEQAEEQARAREQAAAKPRVSQPAHPPQPLPPKPSQPPQNAPPPEPRPPEPAVPPTRMSLPSFVEMLKERANAFFQGRPPSDWTDGNLRAFLREFPAEHVNALLRDRDVRKKLVAAQATGSAGVEAAPVPVSAEPVSKPFIPSEWLLRHHPKIVDRLKAFEDVHKRLAGALEGQGTEQAQRELKKHVAEWYLDAVRFQFAVPKVPPENKREAEEALERLQHQHLLLRSLAERRP